MSPFVTFIDENETYCLQTEFPNYLGILQTYGKGLLPTQLIGYNLFLNFRGTIARNQIGYDLPAAKAIMQQMAFWFEYNTDMFAYEKFKL